MIRSLALIVAAYLGVNGAQAGTACHGPLAAWGDSLTAEWAPQVTAWPSQLARLTGREVYNGGFAGRTSEFIARRQAADIGHQDRVTIIWVGRNNFDDREGVLRDLAAMTARVRSGCYIVLTILNRATVLEEWAGGSKHLAITTLNEEILCRYPGHALDIRRTLVNAFDPLRRRDRLDHERDVPPSSLTTDGLHLNDQGHAVIADALVRALADLKPAITPLETQDCGGHKKSAAGWDRGALWRAERVSVSARRRSPHSSPGARLPRCPRDQ